MLEVNEMFKTELHLHTEPVSACAHVIAKDAVEHYIENGYDTVVITNHMSPTLFNKVVPDGVTEWKDIADIYLEDYRIAKRTAGNRMNVILGMELRVKENMNDYLVYGIDEQFIYDMGNIMDLKFKEISKMFREKGAVIFQAHPFRNNMTVTDPNLLDGIEAYNMTPLTNHNSRNDFANLWAKEHNLIKICGSDYHNKNYLCGCGILTEKEITDSKQLAQILKSRQFSIKL